MGRHEASTSYICSSGTERVHLLSSASVSLHSLFWMIFPVHQVCNRNRIRDRVFFLSPLIKRFERKNHGDIVRYYT